VIPEPAARRYAEAARLLANEEGNQESWLQGLDVLAAVTGDEGAARVLASNRVPAEDKQKLLRRTLEGQPDNVVNMALLLLRRGRIVLAPQIAQAYREILDRERGISHALVTSAVELTGDELKAVEGKLADLAGGPVTVRTEVDPEIIGGLVVRIGDRLIDGSTRSRLQSLKQRLAGVQS
jgi:F-type H+-transporting ATPase subunit delta